MYAWTSRRINMSWLTGKWKERKQREQLQLHVSKEGQILTIQQCISGKTRKKRRNVVTRNTGSGTERGKGKEESKENTRGRGSLCFTSTWQSTAQSKIRLRQDGGVRRDNAKATLQQETHGALLGSISVVSLWSGESWISFWLHETRATDQNTSKISSV